MRLEPTRGHRRRRPEEPDGGRPGDRPVVVLVGLPGSGATTRSTDPSRLLVVAGEGLLDLEGGRYAKAVDLTAGRDPATRPE